MLTNWASFDHCPSFTHTQTHTETERERERHRGRETETERERERERERDHVTCEFAAPPYAHAQHAMASRALLVHGGCSASPGIRALTQDAPGLLCSMDGQLGEPGHVGPMWPLSHFELIGVVAVFSQQVPNGLHVHLKSIGHC